MHDPRTAALLNGIAGRSIELCEGLRFVSGQAAMQVLPGVLAVGEHLGSSGRDMLTALWPATLIESQATIGWGLGDKSMWRTPEILADAAYAVFHKPARAFTGHFLIDDSFLYAEGVRDFERYRADPSQELAPTFFVPDMPPPPPGVIISGERLE